MRYALPGSALVHVAVLGAGLLAFAWPEPDAAPSMETVTVDVISVASVSSNQTSTIDSDASETLVSSGAEATPPTTSETLEPIEPEPLTPTTPPTQPVAAATLEPTEPPPVETAEPPPVEAAEPLPPTPVETATAVTPTTATPVEPVIERLETALLSTLAPSPLTATPLAPLPPPEAETPPEPAQAAVPVESSVIEPESATDLKVAPVPQTLTIKRTSEPTYPDRPRQQQASQRPQRTQPTPERTQPRAEPPAQAGNGGQNNADAVASRASASQQGNSGSGGNADVARYPNQVLSKLRRALRYPRGAGGAAGEVQVQFTVSAGGSPSGIRIARSSGNAAIDQAGLDTVARASPFPPIPAGANRSNWAFTVPLAFVRQ